jgi:phosphatidate cytidylyltransferase
MLPGHGGVLDRIDALTSTLPVAAGALMWLERAA